MNEDGLLCPVDESDDEWLRPSFGEMASEQVLKAAVGWITDVLEARQVVWPATFDGRLAVPPPAHVLDALTRKYLDSGEDAAWEAKWTLRPPAGTVALLPELPECDICRRSGARYDAPEVRRVEARAAYLCPWCYQRRSTTQLGVGHGQFLLRYEEIPGEIWDAARKARRVWRERGAPVVETTPEAAHRKDPPRPMSWPYGPPLKEMETPRQQLLSDVLTTAVVEQDPARGLFSDLVSWDEDGAVTYYTAPHAVDQISQRINFGVSGTEALDSLCRDLSALSGVRRRADLTEVRHLVAREISRILVDGASPAKILARLESGVRQLVGPVVWVAPLGGVTWEGPPRRLGDSCVLGRLGAELHQEINDLAAVHDIGGRLDFEYASAWAEDYEAFRNDPQAFDDWEAEAWRPVVIAQVVDAVGSVAHHLGFQKVYSLSGAIWAAASLGGTPLRADVPWVIGEPGHSSGPTVEDDDEDRGEVTVYTLRDGESKHHRFYFPAAVPITLDEVLSGPQGPMIEVVATWSPGDADDESPVTRLAASARHARAGRASTDLYFTAFHLVAAMETLLGYEPSSIAKTLACRAAAVLGRRSARSEVSQLYDLRSKAAHRGLSPRPLADAAELVDAGWARLPHIMRWLIDRALQGRSMDDIVREIDALPDPEDD